MVEGWRKSGAGQQHAVDRVDDAIARRYVGLHDAGSPAASVMTRLASTVKVCPCTVVMGEFTGTSAPSTRPAST